MKEVMVLLAWFVVPVVIFASAWHQANVEDQAQEEMNREKFFQL